MRPLLVGCCRSKKHQPVSGNVLQSDLEIVYGRSLDIDAAIVVAVDVDVVGGGAEVADGDTGHPTPILVHRLGPEAGRKRVGPCVAQRLMLPFEDRESVFGHFALFSNWVFLHYRAGQIK